MIDLTIPRHEQLRLQNLTVFEDTAFEFVPGINVLLGENGSGKTHVMKALYAWQLARHLADPMNDGKFDQMFVETYGASSIRQLQNQTNQRISLSGNFGGEVWLVDLENNIFAEAGARPKPSRPIFIPAVEMMAHARNMNGILRDYADFDRTCFDFLAMVTAQNRSSAVRNSLKAVDDLQELIPGSVEWNNDEQRFYLIRNANKLPFSMLAEGTRKISALSRLVDTNWIQPGTILFWDEPEVNLNPKWMDDIVKALVALARENVQVFIATHNYVILKSLDLVLRAQKLENQEDLPTRYFSLRREDGVSKVSWADSFAAVEPNAILDQYDKMLAEDWRLQDLENQVVEQGAAG